MEAKKQGSNDQHARAQEAALESGGVYSQVKPRHLRNTAPALSESQKEACIGQKLHTDSANRTNIDDHAEHEFRNGSDDRTKKATPEGQKVCTETEDRATKDTPEGQKVCTETEDRATKDTPEGQKVCTKTEDRANKDIPEGQKVCTKTEDRANKDIPEGQKVCTKTEDRANKDIHAAACSNKSVLEEKRLHGKTNVHNEAPQQAAEAVQTSSSSFPPDIGTTCERDAHKTNQATGDCSRQDAASCDREPGAESAMNVSELGPSQQGSQAEDNAAERKIESFGMRANQPATFRWVAEEDDGSIKDDGYCLLSRAGDSTVTVSKSTVKFSRPIPKEEWFPFTLTDRGQLQERPEARSQSGAGLKDNTRREHSDPHADGWSGDARCNEQQKQQQQQQQQREEGLHSDARTDDAVQRPKLTRKHSLTLEEGCMLVFPHAVRDVTEGSKEASADRQTSGRDSSGGSADGFRHNRQTGSERKVNVVSRTCGSTAEEASEEGVVDGEARTSFDSTERKNCTGTGAFQHSLQQTRKDGAGAFQLSPQQTRKDGAGAFQFSPQQTRKEGAGAFQLSPQQTRKDGAGAFQFSPQQTRKDSGAFQFSPQQIRKDSGAFQLSPQQTRKDTGTFEKDSGDLQRSPQQTRKDSGAFQFSPQQTRKDSGAFQFSPQQTRKDSGAFQLSPQQTRKETGTFEKDSGDLQRSPQQTRKDSGAFQFSPQQTRKDSGAFQFSPQQTRKDSGAFQLSPQQTRKETGTFEKDSGDLQRSPQQTRKDSGAFQFSPQQTRKDSGAFQFSPQQTRKDSGAFQLSPQQTRKDTGTFEKDSGDLQRSPQQTRKDSGADHSHSGVTLLQTCSACLLPSSELTLMQCFHIVCPACISPAEPDCVQCNVCKATQAAPREDAPSLRDMFPGFFQAMSCVSEAASQTVPSEDRTEHLASPEGQAEKPTPEEKSPTNNPDGCETEAQSDEVAEGCDSLLSSSSNSSSSSSSIKAAAAAAARPTQTCGACQEQTETRHACVTCGGIALCGGCRTAHLRLPVTRSHEVVTVTATSLSPLTLLGRHQPVCPRHGQDLALQCCTCGLFLCHRCLAPQHARHEIRELGNLYHTGRKQFSGLQRSVKQYVLAARSARRAADEQLRKVREGRRRACESIAASTQWCIDGIAGQAEELSRAVVRTSEAREFVLAKSQSEVARVQREGERLRGVLEAVCGDTPHLTGLVLHHNCQVRLDRLRRDACLQVEEFEDVVFCPGLQLQEQVASQASLGTVRALATGLPDTVLQVLGTFQTGDEVSSLAPTPYGELVCISSSAGTCRVWDRQGVMLCDVSRHVAEPADVRVTPNGLLVILGPDAQRTEGKACLTLLSPAGSLLTRLPLSSKVLFTRFHCQSDTRILVSDELSQTVTLYAIEKADKPGCCCLRAVRQAASHYHHGPLLQSPCHVTINLTGDWLVNDGGHFLRTVSPEGEVTTVLTEDDPEAVKQPPRSSRFEGCQLSKTRWLTSVWCDSSGRMLVTDVGKNGVYIVTTGTSANRGERLFLSLQEVTSAARLTAMAVDKHDRLIVGMSDGRVSILKIGSDE